MSQVKAAAVPITPRIYPHVDGVPDWHTQQTARLLWDRAADLEARLQAAEANVTALIAAHNVNDTALATTTTTVKQVQATVAAGIPATTSGAGVPPGPPGPLPAPGDPGSQTNPIIAMSADPAQIALSVRASRQFYGFGPNPADDQYWIDKATPAAQFSNGKWYQGWNAYWDARANPANPGSADPNLGGVPSPHG